MMHSSATVLLVFIITVVGGDARAGRVNVADVLGEGEVAQQHEPYKASDRLRRRDYGAADEWWGTGGGVGSSVGNKMVQRCFNSSSICNDVSIRSCRFGALCSLHPSIFLPEKRNG